MTGGILWQLLPGDGRDLPQRCLGIWSEKVLVDVKPGPDEDFANGSAVSPFVDPTVGDTIERIGVFRLTLARRRGESTPVLTPTFAQLRARAAPSGGKGESGRLERF